MGEGGSGYTGGGCLPASLPSTSSSSPQEVEIDSAGRRQCVGAHPELPAAWHQMKEERGRGRGRKQGAGGRWRAGGRGHRVTAGAAAGLQPPEETPPPPWLRETASPFGCFIQPICLLSSHLSVRLLSLFPHCPTVCPLVHLSFCPYLCLSVCLPSSFPSCLTLYSRCLPCFSAFLLPSCPSVCLSACVSCWFTKAAVRDAAERWRNVSFHDEEKGRRGEKKEK